MFTNFKLSDGSMNEVVAARARSRTWTGCLPCRAKKKKCDEQKPVCRRCNKWPFPCLWPQSTKRRSLHWRRIQPEALPIPPIINNSDAIVILARSFENAHLEPYVGLGLSMIKHYEDCSLWPALVHAYAACGAAMHPLGSKGPWVQISLSHYGEAIKILSTSLGSQNTPAVEECTMAVMNSLHIFETLRHDTEARNIVHLKAGPHQFLHRVCDRAQVTLEQKVLVEEHAFQLAIASTFSPTVLDNEDYFWDMGRFLNRTRLAEGAGGVYHTDTLADIGITRDVFSYIFRLSALRRRVPLDERQLQKALEIKAELDMWTPSQSFTIGGPEDAKQASPILMEHLYRIGCLIMLAKIMRPWILLENPSLRADTRKGLNYIEKLLGGRLERASVLIWPIIMIALATINQQERELCLQPLIYLLESRGIGCVRGILSLLDHAWHRDDSRGLDVLFRNDLLSSVLF